MPLDEEIASFTYEHGLGILNLDFALEMAGSKLSSGQIFLLINLSVTAFNDL